MSRPAPPALAPGDWVLAAALTVFAQVDFWLHLESPAKAPAWNFASPWVDELALVTLVFTGTPLFRRRAPLATMLVISAAVLVAAALEIEPLLWGGFIPLLIATYSVACHCELRRATVGALIGAIGIAVLLIRVPELRTGGADYAFQVGPYVAAFALGRFVRANRRARGVQAARTIEGAVESAIAEERARIARELHDIVAHSVSVMVVQAGAAEALLQRAPERAGEPLRSIQDTGRQAIGDLRRMLGLLRGVDSAATLTPQPSMGDLRGLVNQLGEAGLDVDLRVEGRARPLPIGLDVTAYRIVQEALTNTLKHAGISKVRVVLRYADDALELDVEDDGAGAVGIGTGHGLIGMRERVAVYGGTLRAGTRNGRGFAVRARLPLGAAPR